MGVFLSLLAAVIFMALLFGKWLCLRGLWVVVSFDWGLLVLILDAKRASCPERGLFCFLFGTGRRVGHGEISLCSLLFSFVLFLVWLSYREMRIGSKLIERYCLISILLLGLQSYSMFQNLLPLVK